MDFSETTATPVVGGLFLRHITLCVTRLKDANAK